MWEQTIEELIIKRNPIPTKKALNHK